MIDITQQKEKKPFKGKEYAFDVLVGGIPAIIVAVTLKEAGISGFLPIMILLLCGATVIGVIRRKKGCAVSWKMIWYAIAANFIVFIVIPILLITFFT